VGVCRSCGAYTQPRSGEGDSYTYCKPATGHTRATYAIVTHSASHTSVRTCVVCSPRASAHLRILEGRRHVVDRSTRNTGVGQLLEPMRRRVRAQRRLENREQLAAVTVALLEVREPRICRELRRADRDAQAVEELLLRARDNEPAVG
jgi:hypothetical protein